MLVGRARELAEIDGTLTAARAGRGGLVLLAGAAGSGKSRLAEAAVDLAEHAGLTVARTHCVDDPGAPPLWPWRRVVRDWPDVPGADTDEPEASARFRLFVAVADAVAARGRNGGLLIVLEDAHWADRLSVQLLRHLTTELTGLPVLVLATYRDGDPGELGVVLPELARTARTLSLGGLDVAAITAWLPALIGRGDHAVARALHERTGGNPLLVRLVAEELNRDGGAADPASISALMASRPQLRHIVAGRVAPLDAAARALVDAAAVLGERVDLAVLSRMTSDDDVHPAVAAAAAAGVLRADGAAFEHALVRDAVYAELPPPRRAVLHRRAADALEAVSGESAAGSIATHLERAGALADCARWAEVADDQARAVGANDAATRYAELALQSARSLGAEDTELARLLVRLAEARILAGLVESSLAACVDASDLAVAAGRADLVARAALVVHGVGHPLAHRTVPGLCERALVMIGADDRATRARLLAQLAVCVAETEGGPRPAELASEALAEAERSGDDDAILEAIAARHLAIGVPQTVTERLALSRRAIEVGTRVRRPMGALWGHLWRADAAFQLGNLSEVDHEVDELDRVARERGSVIARWHYHRFSACRDALVGAFADSREHDAAAEAIGRGVGDISLIGLSFAFRAYLAHVRGDPADLPPLVTAEVAALMPSMPLVEVSLVLQGCVAGRLDEARAAFEQYRELPRTFPVGVRWAGTLGQIGRAAIALGDVEVAESVRTALAPIAHYYGGDGSGGVFSYGSNDGLLADLAQLAGAADEALALYRDAVAMNVRIGARPHTALNRLGWARTLVHTGQDLPRAAELTAQAAAEFRRLDMPGPLRTADLLAQAIRDARASAETPLSARESQVAALVAHALSNRQIAERLVLSERTVETHVRNILGKLGFSARTEIIAWQLRPGHAE